MSNLRRELAALDAAERALRSTAHGDDPPFGVVTPAGRLYCMACAAKRSVAGKTYERVYGPPHSRENCDACGRPLDVVHHEAMGRAEQERGLKSVRILPTRRARGSAKPRREAVFITMVLAEGDTSRTVYSIWKGPYRCVRGKWSADYNLGTDIETVEARRNDPRATGALAPFPIEVVQTAEKWAAEYGLPLAHRDDLCAAGGTR